MLTAKLRFLFEKCKDLGEKSDKKRSPKQKKTIAALVSVPCSHCHRITIGIGDHHVSSL